MSLDELSNGIFTQEDWSAFYNSRSSMTDRETVIRHAAVFELILKRLITYKLNCPPDTPLEPDIAALFSGDGQFSTFAARIKECKRLGQIDRDTRRDLEIIKVLRNVFAHSPRELTLGTQELETLCKDFRSREQTRYKGRFSRTIFDHVTELLLTKLKHRWRVLYSEATGEPLEDKKAIFKYGVSVTLGSRSLI
jgi:hypothetical protein